MNNKKIIMIFGITIFSAILIDAITKYLATDFITQKINIIGEYFYIDLINNQGIAFGINLPFLKIITLVLIISIFYYYFKEEKKKKNKLVDISFGLILGGAIGNGIERLFFGSVTDFIGVKFFSVFNFADIYICIGAIMYFYYLFKTKD